MLGMEQVEDISVTPEGAGGTWGSAFHPTPLSTSVCLCQHRPERSRVARTCENTGLDVTPSSCVPGLCQPLHSPRFASKFIKIFQHTCSADPPISYYLLYVIRNWSKFYLWRRRAGVLIPRTHHFAAFGMCTHTRTAEQTSRPGRAETLGICPYGERFYYYCCCCQKPANFTIQMF